MIKAVGHSSYSLRSLALLCAVTGDRYTPCPLAKACTTSGTKPPLYRKAYPFCM